MLTLANIKSKLITERGYNKSECMAVVEVQLNVILENFVIPQSQRSLKSLQY